MLPCLERLVREMFGCFQGVAPNGHQGVTDHHHFGLFTHLYRHVHSDEVCTWQEWRFRNLHRWCKAVTLVVDDLPTSTNITDVPSPIQPGSHNDHQCICNAVGGNLAVGSGSSRTSLPNGCGTTQWMKLYIAGGKVGVEGLVKLDLRSRRPCLSLGIA
jgi:hypothetical protein